MSTFTCHICNVQFQGNPKTPNRISKYCSSRCYGDSKKIPLEKIFWSHVDKESSPYGCWLWTGSLRRGYGCTFVNRKKTPAHRLSYELHYGPLPQEKMACHRCDAFYPPGDTTYRRCIRPEHLFLGSGKENMEDCVNKGRIAKGEKQGNAKLSEQNVREMLKMRSEGITLKILAEHFHTSITNASAIVKRKSWKHIDVNNTIPDKPS